MVTDRARKPPTTPNQASISSKQTVIRTPPPLTAKNNPVKTHQNTIQRSTSVTSTPSPSNVVSKSNTILVNTIIILIVLKFNVRNAATTICLHFS